MHTGAQISTQEPTLIDVKSTSISRKSEVHIESNFHFSVSIDVFNHFDATNLKDKINVGV